MKIVFPENIFAQLIIENLPAGNEIIKKPSSLIAMEIDNNEDWTGLIPTTDLIKYKELYVSRSFGISFEDSLCNSYIYYASGGKDISEINLFGDISSLEVLLCKILFAEMYNKTVEVKIAANEKNIANKNVLITGNKNFIEDRFLKGISFAEEIVETLSLPFVNYVFASKRKNLIEQVNKLMKGISNSIYNRAEEMDFNFDIPEKAKSYLKENISSFVIDFTDQDIEGVSQLLRLPFYHGIINDIIEVKFV